MTQHVLEFLSPDDVRRIAAGLDVRQYRILRAVEREISIDYIREHTSADAPVRIAHDAMLRHGLIAFAGKGYMLTRGGRDVMEAAAVDGRIIRIVGIEDEIQAASHLMVRVQPIGPEEMPMVANTGIARDLHINLDAYDEVMVSLKTRMIGVDTVVHNRRGTRRSVEKALVLSDRTRLLPSGDVLHELFAFVCRDLRIGHFFAIRSHPDRLWITADTELAARRRFEKHVVVKPVEVDADDRTQEEVQQSLADDAAIEDAFL